MKISPTAPQLDVLRFPLQGSRLIEASAGTGKTFTIALLYVRLVLGHGEANGFGRALMPPEILVVTFTDAATQELRDRIRRRLAEAAEIFRADPATVTAPAAGDDPLYALRGEYPPEAWLACARQLQLAAEWMDEAAVSTIHAWCNRMLREHAFDSDSLFTQTLETDQSELLAEAARDYWRTFLALLPVEDALTVRGWWASPDELCKALGRLISHVGVLEAAPVPAESLRGCREARRERLHALKAPWPDWVDALRSLLDDAVSRKQVDGRKLQARYYLSWLQALADWSRDEHAVRPELTKSGWERLTPPGMAAAWKSGTPPAHPGFAAIAALPEALAALPEARIEVLRHATRWVAERFMQEQRCRAQMGFNDLLTRLRDALLGPNGERLAGIIRRQFPVALIDEFQDTDPVQYQIFDAVYQVADPEPDTALVLIGDPKQAIYAFRGADIYTYLKARQACADRHYTLKINYRSTTAMVAASNRWFEVAEARTDGAGAFLFRTAGGNPVPFVSAVAQGRNQALIVNGQTPPALTVWQLPPREDGKPLTKEGYYESMAESCASEMTRLLRLGQTGAAGLAGEGGFQALRPADLAVLVNGRAEADAIRGALARRGVRSVYLSDRDTVFQSAQAAELLCWLTACAEPDDPGLLRAALATATLGLTWQELDTLNHDELAWEARVMQFRGYRESWWRQGVLPMLRRLLNDFMVPARLLDAASDRSAPPLNGERILTDILHLAELLQQASARLDGEHALIRYLAEQIANPMGESNSATRQIRLESDADLVQVVTVHKAKGLEYPLVFLPYAGNYRLTKTGDLPLAWHDAAGALHLSLAAEPEALEKTDRERLGEDLRKFYVALTRARYATWVGVAPLKDLERSAVGYLLAGGAPVEPAALPALLEELAAGSSGFACTPAPSADGERYVAQAAGATGLALTSARVLREPWWIASYSALTRNWASAPLGSAQDAPVLDDTPGAEAFLEAYAHPSDEFPPSGSTAPTAWADALHEFPRGAEAGAFLHDLLEWAANQGFATLSAPPACWRDSIARRCQAHGWTHWIDPLCAWLQQFVAAPLALSALNGMTPATFTLAGLEAPLAEMEFWMAVRQTEVAQIDRLVTELTLDAAPRPTLQAGQLNGLLKGFIDLVLAHDGRYYVLDYKSNWLGPDATAYAPAALREVILQERYELQYVLYLLALHRHLRARLPDYAYDRHIGGAVYVFLRGLGAPTQGLHVERPPGDLVETLDAWLAGAAAGASS